MKQIQHPRGVNTDARPRLAAKARLAHDKISGKPILLFPETVLFLTGSAAATLALCDGRHSISALVAVLADRYGACASEVNADVEEFLATLCERGLIEFVAEEVVGA